MKKIYILVFILLSALILSGCSLTKKGDIKGAEIQVSDQGTKIPLDIVKDGYFKGPKDAKITIVEFSDYQCPACKSMSVIIDEVVKEYPNEVRLVYRNFPLSYHQFSFKAATAAEAAGKQGKFWEMHDLIFANNSQLSDDKFLEFAQELGLNIEQFKQDMASMEINDKIKRDLDEGQNTLQIRGTPTFYLNNVEYKGNYNIEGFKTEINKILNN